MADFDFEKFKQDIVDSVSSAADTVAEAARSAAEDTGRFKQFYETGRYLERHNLISITGGNLSVSDGATIWITKTGSRLGFLTPADIITCGWTDDASTTLASVEFKVHRAMYGACARSSGTDAALLDNWAIVHAHPIHAIAATLESDSLVPLDNEGLHYLGLKVPVLNVKDSTGSEEVASLMDVIIGEGGCVAIVRGHGAFSIGADLKSALQLMVALERSAHIITVA